jgi:hypothetical protein
LDFLAVDQDEAVRVGQPSQFVKFFIGPAHSVFGKSDALKVRLHGLMDKIWGADEGAIGVGTGMEMNIESHHK